MCGVGGKIEFTDTGANHFSKSESSETPILNTQKEDMTEEQIEKKKNNENIAGIIVAIIFFAIVLSIILLG